MMKKNINVNNQNVELVKAHENLVACVAKQYLNQGLTMSELIHEGNYGLIKAAEKFDASKGFQFESYAVWWVRQSILQALADKSQGVECGELTEREKFILQHTDEEAAAQLEISLRRVKEFREQALRKQNPTT